MTFWLLFFLGLITYTILQRNVASITRTPIWLLWLVMMTPALMLTVWGATQGANTPMPPLLTASTFLVCFSLYWWLVSAGRIPPGERSTDLDDPDSADFDPTLQPLSRSRSRGQANPNKRISRISRVDRALNRSTPDRETDLEADLETHSQLDPQGDLNGDPIADPAANPLNQPSSPQTRQRLNARLSKSLEQLRPINPEEETQLRDCFSWSVYALHSLEYRPQAVICRGQLRTNPEHAYDTVRQNIERHFGDRFLVVFQEGAQKKPFFLLAPNPSAQRSTSDQPNQKSAPAMPNKPLLALGLFVVTLFTTTTIGVSFAGVSATDLANNPALLGEGLSYSLSLLLILGTHEFGHYFCAKRHRVPVVLPYFIPVPFFLGTLGAFVQMRSPMPDRKVLFDISVAGPIAGFICSLPLLIWGLAHSDIVAATEQANLLNFTELQPQFSCLLSLLCRFVLPAGLNPENAIVLHPVAISGYLGLILTAFNLMPIGQLDGGHMVHAIFGREMGRSIAQITRLIMLALALIHPELFLWALFLLLMPAYDEPALNDVTELDNTRDAIGLACLALLLLILLPAPNFLG